MANKITIELAEDDLIALLHGCAQSSCGYNRDHVEDDMWHLHCCEYNEPIKRTVKQIDSAKLKDKENKKYIEKLQNEADLMEYLEKEYLEDL